jgi:hypothetical protein
MARASANKRKAEEKIAPVVEKVVDGQSSIEGIHTDPLRWRLLDEDGRQTWHYLDTDEENKKWPQSYADKFHLGLESVRALRTCA